MQDLSFAAISLQGSWLLASAPEAAQLDTNLSAKAKAALRSLPIFESVEVATRSGEVSKADHGAALMHNLEGEWFLAPTAIPAKAVPPSTFLFAGSAYERRALMGLGVAQVSLPAFCRKHVLGRMGALAPSMVEIVMCEALRQLPSLLAEDRTLGDLLRVSAFVSTASGQLCAPQNLFDPRVPELLAILDPHSYFPVGEFASQPILGALGMLGMQAVATRSAIFSSARSVESLAASSPAAAMARGSALLQYLEIASHGLSSRSCTTAGPIQLSSMLSRLVQRSTSQDGEEAGFWAKMQDVAWCPALVLPPVQAQGLPWVKECSSPVERPKSLRPPADLWLVSASMRVLNGECRSAVLATQLGWDRLPPTAAICQQLQVSCITWTSPDSPCFYLRRQTIFCWEVWRLRFC